MFRTPFQPWSRSVKLLVSPQRALKSSLRNAKPFSKAAMSVLVAPLFPIPFLLTIPLFVERDPTATRFSPIWVNKFAVYSFKNVSNVKHFYHCGKELSDHLATVTNVYAHGLTYDKTEEFCQLYWLISHDQDFTFNSTGVMMIYLAGSQASRGFISLKEYRNMTLRDR